MPVEDPPKMYPPSQRILTVVPYRNRSGRNAAIMQAKAFVQAVVQHDPSLDSSDPDSSTSMPQEELRTGDCVVTWTIDNKYYTADVHFMIHPLMVGKSDQPEGRGENSVVPGTEELQHAIQEVRAVLLFLTPSLEETSLVHRLSRILESCCQTTELDVALVARIGCAESTESRTVTNALQTEIEVAFGDHWEIVDLVDDNIDDDGSTSQHSSSSENSDFPEEGGIERIRTALMSNVWPGHVLKSQVSSPPQPRLLAEGKDQGVAGDSSSFLVDTDSRVLDDIDLLLQGAPASLEVDAVPTEEDEKLAAEFIERISAFEGRFRQQLDSPADADAHRQEARMLLEQFLDANDDPLIHRQSESRGIQLISSPFDDDFADFVEGSDVDAFGDAMLPAIPSLEALQADAQRIRDLPDENQRRSEAERVSLLFARMMLHS